MWLKQLSKSKQALNTTTQAQKQRLPRCQVANYSATTAREDDTPASTDDIATDKIKSRPSKKNQRTYLPSKVVFSGIQPTGIPHLGNYLGALRQWKDLQDQKSEPNHKKRRNHRLFFSIVDLHSLTNLAKDSTRHRSQLTRESYASLLAIGLDPNYSNIFVQSHNADQHSQLMWILSTVASTGYLSRMTQWKSKLGLGENASLDDQSAKEKLRLGLFSYPVLQAADILLYRSDCVPVGEDQVQHVEFARSIARSFNSQYCGPESSTGMTAPVFPVPEPLVSKTACRIMSLKDPTKKMSKSDPNLNSRIMITDTPDEIRTKLKGALTDSHDPSITYDPAARPGVSNLIDILKDVTRSTESCEDIASQHQSTSLGAFKDLVTSETIKCLDGISERYRQVMSDASVEQTMLWTMPRVRSRSSRTMASVERAIGLYGREDAVRDLRQKRDTVDESSKNQ